jgi:hypothetical protein
VRFNPLSEDEARQASARKLLKTGWRRGRITEAVERPDKNGDDMTELLVMVDDRSLRDFISPKWSAAKHRNCCLAVGAVEQYQAGETSPQDFVGHDVEVRIGIEKRRGYRDVNRIEDYRAASASAVVTLHRAAS